MRDIRAPALIVTMLRLVAVESASASAAAHIFDVALAATQPHPTTAFAIREAVTRWQMAGETGAAAQRQAGEGHADARPALMFGHGGPTIDMVATSEAEPNESTDDGSCTACDNSGEGGAVTASRTGVCNASATTEDDSNTTTSGSEEWRRVCRHITACSWSQAEGAAATTPAEAVVVSLQWGQRPATSAQESFSNVPPPPMPPALLAWLLSGKVPTQAPAAAGSNRGLSTAGATSSAPSNEQLAFSPQPSPTPVPLRPLTFDDLFVSTLVTARFPSPGHADLALGDCCVATIGRKRTSVLARALFDADPAQTVAFACCQTLGVTATHASDDQCSGNESECACCCHWLADNGDSYIDATGVASSQEGHALSFTPSSAGSGASLASAAVVMPREAWLESLADWFVARSTHFEEALEISTTASPAGVAGLSHTAPEVRLARQAATDAISSDWLGQLSGGVVGATLACAMSPRLLPALVWVALDGLRQAATVGTAKGDAASVVSLTDQPCESEKADGGTHAKRLLLALLPWLCLERARLQPGEVTRAGGSSAVASAAKDGSTGDPVTSTSTIGFEPSHGAQENTSDSGGCKFDSCSDIATADDEHVGTPPSLSRVMALCEAHRARQVARLVTASASAAAAPPSSRPAIDFLAALLTVGPPESDTPTTSASPLSTLRRSLGEAIDVLLRPPCVSRGSDVSTSNCACMPRDRSVERRLAAFVHRWMLPLFSPAVVHAIAALAARQVLACGGNSKCDHVLSHGAECVDNPRSGRQHTSGCCCCGANMWVLSVLASRVDMAAWPACCDCTWLLSSRQVAANPAPTQASGCANAGDGSDGVPWCGRATGTPCSVPGNIVASSVPHDSQLSLDAVVRVESMLSHPDAFHFAFASGGSPLPPRAPTATAAAVLPRDIPCSHLLRSTLFLSLVWAATARVGATNFAPERTITPVRALWRRLAMGAHPTALSPPAVPAVSVDASRRSPSLQPPSQTNGSSVASGAPTLGLKFAVPATALPPVRLIALSAAQDAAVRVRLPASLGRLRLAVKPTHGSRAGHCDARATASGIAKFGCRSRYIDSAGLPLVTLFLVDVVAHGRRSHLEGAPMDPALSTLLPGSLASLSEPSSSCCTGTASTEPLVKWLLPMPQIHTATSGMANPVSREARLTGESGLAADILITAVLPWAPHYVIGVLARALSAYDVVLTDRHCGGGGSGGSGDRIGATCLQPILAPLSPRADGNANAVSAQRPDGNNGKTVRFLACRNSICFVGAGVRLPRRRFNPRPVQITNCVISRKYMHDAALPTSRGAPPNTFPCNGGSFHSRPVACSNLPPLRFARTPGSSWRSPASSHAPSFHCHTATPPPSLPPSPARRCSTTLLLRWLRTSPFCLPTLSQCHTLPRTLPPFQISHAPPSPPPLGRCLSRWLSASLRAHGSRRTGTGPLWLV